MRHSNVLSNKKQRFFFFNVGLIVALLLVVLAFKIDFEKEDIVIEFDDPFLPTVYIDQVASHKEKNEVPETVNPRTNSPEATERINPFGDEKYDERNKDDNRGNASNVDVDTFVSIFMPPEPDTIEPQDAVEIMPEFPGGLTALRKYLGDNLIYPDLEAEIGVSGTVYVQFIVSEDGIIDQIKGVRFPSSGLKLEAERVVKKMPKWEAGIQNGKRVKVRYTLPIKFQLVN